MITLQHYLILSAILFSIGLLIVVIRRNAIAVLMGVELILNSANINLVAFNHYTSRFLYGQMFAIFVIIIAACEAAVALAIVLNIYNNFGSIDIDEVNNLKE